MNDPFTAMSALWRSVQNHTDHRRDRLTLKQLGSLAVEGEIGAQEHQSQPG